MTSLLPTISYRWASVQWGFSPMSPDLIDPQVLVNLLPELGVGVDLVSHDHWHGETFKCGVGRLVEFMLSVSGFCSETNEFHKPVPIGLTAPNSHGTRTILTRHLEQSPRFGRLAAPLESGDRAKRCPSEG